MSEDGKKRYYCDPFKNAVCKKKECYINNGSCYKTSHEEYAVLAPDGTVCEVFNGDDEGEKRLMPKVKCTSIDCKYNDKNLYCTAKSIHLHEASVMTVWEGRQQFWRCNLYEMTERAKQIAAEFAKLHGGRA